MLSIVLLTIVTASLLLPVSTLSSEEFSFKKPELKIHPALLKDEYYSIKSRDLLSMSLSTLLDNDGKVIDIEKTLKDLGVEYEV